MQFQLLQPELINFLCILPSLMAISSFANLASRFAIVLVKGSGDSEEVKLVRKRIDATISFHDNQIPICKFKIYEITWKFIDITIMICLIIEIILFEFLLTLKQNSDLSMCFGDGQLKMWRCELQVKCNTKFCDAKVLLTERVLFLSRSCKAKSGHGYPPAPEENETWNEMKPSLPIQCPLITHSISKRTASPQG